MNTGKKQRLLSMAGACLFMAVMLSVVYIRGKEEALAADIAPEVLRFHVLANSDSPEDQQLKMEVRSLLLQEIYDGMTKEADREAYSKEELAAYIRKHKGELEEQAEAFMADRGFGYPAEIRLESCQFPTRIYGDTVFPCGTYDAVRVLIGSGEGHNWWCVLYPPLCFTKESYAVLPDESKEELQNLLPEKDYRELMANRTLVFGESDGRGMGLKKSAPSEEDEKTVVHVTFRFLDLFR